MFRYHIKTCLLNPSRICASPKTGLRFPSDSVVTSVFRSVSGMVCVVFVGCQRNSFCCCHWLSKEWCMLLSLIVRGMVYVINVCKRKSLWCCHLLLEEWKSLVILSTFGLFFCCGCFCSKSEILWAIHNCWIKVYLSSTQYNTQICHL